MAKLLAFCAILYNVFCWHSDARSAISMVAMSSIRGDNLSVLKKFLKGKDLVDISPWLTGLLTSYPEIGNLTSQHDHTNIKSEIARCDKLNTDCPNNMCLINAVKYYYLSLIDHQSAGSMTDFTNPIKTSASDDFRMFVSLLAELFSFDHFYYDADHAVPQLTIAIPSRSHESSNDEFTQSYSLPDYWSYGIVDSQVKINPHAWYGGWTHVQNINRGLISKVTAQWDSSPNKLDVFDAWAQETWARACEFGFRDTGIESTIPGELGMLRPQGTVPLVQIMEDQRTLRNHILESGFKLSLAVKHVLSHSNPNNLRSAVNINVKQVDDSVNRMFSPAETTHSSWLYNLAVNMSILLAVCSVMYIALRYITPKPVYAQQRVD